MAAIETDPFTLLLRPTSVQTRIEGLSKVWDDIRDDYAIIDGETRVGRIYKQQIYGEPRWLWFLKTKPAPAPNSGMAGTLEECAADFKRRYALIRVAEQIAAALLKTDLRLR